MSDVSRVFATAVYDPFVGLPLLAAGVLLAVAWTTDPSPGWREGTDLRRWVALVATVIASWSFTNLVERSSLLLGSWHPVALDVATTLVALPLAWLALASRPSLVTVAAIALTFVRSPADPSDAAAWTSVLAWTTTAWWARGVRPRLTRVGAFTSVIVGATLTHLTWGTAVASVRGLEPSIGALVGHATSGPWFAALLLALLVAVPRASIWSLAAPVRSGVPSRDPEAMMPPTASTHARSPRPQRAPMDRPLLPTSSAGRAARARDGRSMATPAVASLVRNDPTRE